ncbi:MAG: PilC/PilY family type IV pilus protein [Gammaproteobacteria bacterium]
MTDFVSAPILTVRSAIPQVMFVMGKDHQYWLKAYNDFTDLDGDGEIDTTYKHDFEYYGYFDPEKCYSYVKEGISGSGQVEFFKPMAFTPDRYCDNVAGEWSGSFLNWAAMTRMDIVRRIMFGGKRLEDGSDFTFLQRAYLPSDSHSFAKYYTGDDIHKLTPFTGIDTALDGTIGDRDRGITICNITQPRSSGKSDSISLNTNNNPPLIRVAEGNYSLWATSERWNCRWSEERNNTLGNGPGSNGNDFAVTGIPAHDDNPSESGDGLASSGFGPNYNVYIQACVDGLINAENNENCRQYPNGNYKPAGLIQVYGEEELIHFGMMQGSYEKNLSGGVLRKNIGNLADEINIDTDGTLKADPNSAVPSVGMTRALDVIRLYGYEYNSGTYFGSNSSDSCGFGTASFAEGTCNSWGNPISEIYMEALRYFGGQSPTAAFEANDNSFVGGLAEDDWEDPLSSNNYCAGLDTIVFNTSISSFDQNQTGGIADIGAASPDALTDIVAAGENILGNDFFIGRTPDSAGDDDDGFCTAKTVNSLGNVRGICPEGPTVEGGYHLAGMAHYAKTNDIRPDLEGTQTVNTYAVQLATNVPSIEALLDPTDPDGDKVIILPAYRRLTNQSAGTIVDFRIVDPQTEVNPATGTIMTAFPDTDNQRIEIGDPQPGSGVYDAKFYVNWEDNEAGGDYDADLFGLIGYRLDTNNNTITIVTDAVAESTSGGQLFGFIINGTTQDAFHAFSGIEGANSPDTFPAVGGRPAVSGCSNCRPSVAGGSNGTGQYGVQRHTFDIDLTAAAELLENPLYYAAKWGGFEDVNNNGIPDLDEEWDTRDADGQANPDGVPDNYFFVSNPAQLEDSLRRIFDEILERVSSGTAAAVVANEQAGVGAVYQALFDPLKSDNFGNEVKWFGTLQSLFIDSAGLIREDGNANGTLDSYQVDKVVEIFFDESDQTTKVRRFNSSEEDVFVSSGSFDVALEDLKPIWNARKTLADLSDVSTQRTYTDPANNGRHILTWLDGNLDGLIDDGEVTSFHPDQINNNNYGWLDLDTLAEAQDLIRYIRGEEIAGTRSRTLDFEGDGTTQVMRLGDIVNSTPTPVAAPAEAFDLLAGDASYATFRSQYANRRQVVYTGANDGMLHAFNAGFFDVSNLEFSTTPVDGSSATAHPLGSELWAYVPKNLLPHLQWLPKTESDPNGQEYEHVYYVDGQPRVFDARIFPTSATHPGGWGTVLVVGFRLGGGTDVGTSNGIEVLPDPAETDTVQTKSAYVVMDITNPEQPPKVLAELTPPNLQFTTSFPTVALIGSPTGTKDTDNWYLIFGSGPNNLGTITSSQRARLYAYDLERLGAGAADNGVVTAGDFTADGLDLGVQADGQFVGNPVTSDFDIDMRAEAMYFGTIGDVDADEGKLWRMAIAENGSPADWGSPHILLNTDQPFLAQPSLTIDEFSQEWIIASTGRFFSNPDKASTSQQTLYGFKEPNDLSDATSNIAVDPANLLDVSDAVVFTDGNVDSDGDGTNDMTFDELEQCTTGQTTCDGNIYQGWKRDYVANSLDPSQRSINRSAVLGGIVFNTAFTPTEDLCGAEGTSILLGLAFNTGTTIPEGVFGTEACSTCPDGVFESKGEISLGFGLASSPSIHVGKPGQDDLPGKVTVVIQKSTGEISSDEAQTSGGLRSGEISWREFID